MSKYSKYGEAIRIEIIIPENVHSHLVKTFGSAQNAIDKMVTDAIIWELEVMEPENEISERTLNSEFIRSL